MVTGLDIKPTHARVRPVGDKISLLAHYFDGATANNAETGPGRRADEGGQDARTCSHPDGFNAALMVVRALARDRRTTSTA